MSFTTPHMIMDVAERELGKSLEPTNSFQEALEQAELNFKVRKGPIFFANDSGEHVPFANRQATYREDTQEALGVVTPNYSVIQNDEAFTAFDSILSNNEVTLTDARVFMNGARLCLLGKFTEPIRVLGDEVNPYLMFVNSHDGRTACIIHFSPIRVTCTNVLPMASQRKDMPECVAIHHTGNTTQKLQDAAETLSLARGFFLSFTERSHILARRAVTGGELDRFFQTVFNAPKDRAEWSRNLENKLDTVATLFDQSEFPNSTKDSWWAAYNVAAEYMDWKVSARTGQVSERATRSAWLGSARLAKRRAFELAMNYARGTA